MAVADLKTKARDSFKRKRYELAIEPLDLDLAIEAATGEAERVAEAVPRDVEIEWYGDPDHRSYRVAFDKIEALGYESFHHGQGQWNGVAILSRVGIEDPIGGFGDGGLVTTRDRELAAKLKQMRMHGQSGPYLHPDVGGNFRLDALHQVLDFLISHGIGDEACQDNDCCQQQLNQ